MLPLACRGLPAPCLKIIASNIVMHGSQVIASSIMTAQKFETTGTSDVTVAI